MEGDSETTLRPEKCSPPLQIKWRLFQVISHARWKILRATYLGDVGRKNNFQTQLFVGSTVLNVIRVVRIQIIFFSLNQNICILLNFLLLCFLNKAFIYYISEKSAVPFIKRNEMTEMKYYRTYLDIYFEHLQSWGKTTKQMKYFKHKHIHIGFSNYLSLLLIQYK